MNDPDAGGSQLPHGELSEIDETMRILANAVGRGELADVAASLNDDHASLMLRLAKHFSSDSNQQVVASDGHPIPDRVGRFKILREIGSGGFGVVYLAHDETIGRNLAIKLPRRDLMRDASRREQMVSEARTAGALDHPGIIPIFECGCDGDTMYIASAYCNGPDLGSWLASRELRPSPHEAAAFMSKLAGAVAHAHSQGVIHRDIKPSNVLLARGDVSESVEYGELERSFAFELAKYQPRLTDFGLATLADKPITDTRTSLIVGTPLYMAPEQMVPDLGPVTPRTDIYSLGSLLAELLLGSPLLAGKTHIEILSVFQSETQILQQLVPQELPGDLRKIIGKCLSRQPENRYGSAEALAEDLDAFVEGRSIQARSLGLWDRALSWCRDARRTREASIFSLGTMFFMTSWVMYSLLLAWGPTFPGEDRLTPSIQALAILATVNFPLATLAYLGLRGWIGAMFAAALFLLVGNVIVPALIMGDVIGLLDPVYGPFPYFKKSFHALILLIGLAQLFYYVIGIYAHRWNAHRYSKLRKL